MFWSVTLNLVLTVENKLTLPNNYDCPPCIFEKSMNLLNFRDHKKNVLTVVEIETVVSIITNLYTLYNKLNGTAYSALLYLYLSLFSLFFKVATDSEQKFTFVESGMAGANHDTYVLDNSTLGPLLENTDRLGDYFLLGDSG